MIYLFYGGDEMRSRAKYNEIIGSLRAKNPAASQFRINTENFTPQIFEELTRGQGLFYQKFIIGCDNLFDQNKDNQTLIETARLWLEPAAHSDNIFIFLENRAASEDLIRLKALAGKAQEFSSTRDLPTDFNLFLITDALATRNKKRLWSLYREALWRQLSPEDVFWKLVWQINNLRLVKQTVDLSKLKMKPYPLTKTKTAAKNFSVAELNRLSADLVELYHRWHLGTDEFEFGLEKIILSV